MQVHIRDTWIHKERTSGEWQVGSIAQDSPIPFPRFPSWKEAIDYAHAAVMQRAARRLRQAMAEEERNGR